jgi:hypothetical protein
MTQEQLSKLKALYYDFVYIRAFHSTSPLAERMAEIDVKFEKLLMEMMAQASVKQPQ